MRNVSTATLAAGLLLGGVFFLPGPRAEAQTEPLNKPPKRPDPGIRTLPPPAPRVDLEILVDGKPLPTVPHEGKNYLPVNRLGQEYAIRVRNRGARRIVAVVSVDGLSVLDGQPASDSSLGYVIAPRDSVLIKGWRRDKNTVAAFSFVESDKSFAAASGRPENVGVIRLLAIEEKAAPKPRPRPRPRPLHSGTTARSGKATSGGVGTGYGREIDSAVRVVPFTRGPNRRVIAYQYEAADALRQLGVPLERRPVIAPGDDPPLTGEKKQ